MGARASHVGIIECNNAEGKPAPDALGSQLRAYDGWVRAAVLPHARTDFRLPEPIHAYDLRQVGIDIPPQELTKQAELIRRTARREESAE